MRKPIRLNLTQIQAWTTLLVRPKGPHRRPVENNFTHFPRENPRFRCLVGNIKVNPTQCVTVFFTFTETIFFYFLFFLELAYDRTCCNRHWCRRSYRLGGMSGSQSQPLTAYLWPAYGRQLPTVSPLRRGDATSYYFYRLAIKSSRLANIHLCTRN